MKPKKKVKEVWPNQEVMEKPLTDEDLAVTDEVETWFDDGSNE